MPRTVRRNARSGRFTSKKAVARSKRTTSTERVGRGTTNKTTVHRSTITGRFVTASTAQRRPASTIRQKV